QVLSQAANRYRLALFVDHPGLAVALANRNAVPVGAGAGGSGGTLRMEVPSAGSGGTVSMDIPMVPGLPPTASAPALPDPGRSLFEAAKESGAQVPGFHPALRSLEDIFLEAVE